MADLRWRFEEVDGWEHDLGGQRAKSTIGAMQEKSDWHVMQ
ncbi:MAG TPA: hypothetical protein VG674_18440 [Amycolatopsis sp.]|jgi:hypothetical protein|nr:hypothetical protein [Amycolatopsis sp.]